jgi:hypothetical protein
MSPGPIGRRAVTVALASLMLLAATIIPLAATVSAAQTSTNCPPIVEEGGGCILVISSPSSVQTGVPFTVKVLITTDGTTPAKTDPCGSNAVVTLTATFVGDPTYSATAKNGVATFTITLPDPGPWELTATATNSANGCEFFLESDTKNVEAVQLNPGEPIAPCPPDTNCVQVTSGTGSQATLIADLNGTDWGNPDFIAAIPTGNCSSGGPLDPGNGVLEFFFTGPASKIKTIVFALDSQLVNKGIGQFNVCWNNGGALFKDKNGQMVTTGDLPDCKSGTLPCVASKTSGPHNVAFITVHADPTDTNDPFGYGH